MPDPNPSGIPQITDKRAKIAGLLPKNAQSLLLGGIALAMILVIAFSGRNTPKAKHGQPPETAVATIEPDQVRIQEYRARIEEQTQKLATEEAQLAQAKQTFGRRQGESAISSASVTPPTYRSSTPGEAQMSWADLDREKRQYQSLFASNIALSYRTPATHSESSLPVLAPTKASSSAIAPESVLPADDTSRRVLNSRPVESSNQTSNSAPEYRLFEGTVLETVLTNRLDGSFSGPVNCMVTTNVYSHDGGRLLIPQGSRVLGEVKKLESFGQARLAVFFHRLIMPDGFSVSLDQFQGLDQVGETGLRDAVNYHYLQIFGASMAIGAVAGLAQANTRYGLDESAADSYQQGVATSLSQSSLHILDRYLNVLPTFTIREGYRVKVYLSQDLMLPAYDQHAVRDDL